MDKKQLRRIYFGLMKFAIKELFQIRKLNKNLPPEKVSPIVDAAMKELKEHRERIDLREEVAKLNWYDRFSDFKLITVTNNNDILKGFIEAENEAGFNHDEKVGVAEFLLEGEEGIEFIDDSVNAIINYYYSRKDCAFPEVAEFVDDHISEFSKEEYLLSAVSLVFEGYKKDMMDKPFDIEEKKTILDRISFITPEYLENKNRESLIDLVNASILTTREYAFQINNGKKEKVRGMARRIVRFEDV